MSKRKKINRGQWSADEVRLLKELLPNKRLSEIAEKLGRSAGAVRRKRYSIGIRYPRRLWSEREIKLVKDLFPAKGPHQIARKIGRSVSAVKEKAYSMGLTRIGRRRHRRWSADELRLLKELLPNKTLSEVARRLGRPAAIVNQKVYSMGLKKIGRRSYRRWSADELRLLKELLPTKTLSDVARRLGRPAAIVNQKVYSMGLKKIGLRSYRRWSADELRLLKELLPNKTLSEVAQRLGRSAGMVSAKARKMGFRYECSRQPGRPWSKREVKLVKKLFPGKGTEVIARKIGRSVSAVKQRAYQMGLTRDGFRHWSAKDIRLLKKAYPIHSDSKQLAKRFGRPLSAVRQRAYDMGLTKQR